MPNWSKYNDDDCRISRRKVMKWRNKKFTLMVVPDANSSVLRFQLSTVVLVIGLAVTVALIALSVTAFLLYRGNSSQIGQLKQQLSKASDEYEQIIVGKDEHIDQLQTDLTDLSEQ